MSGNSPLKTYGWQIGKALISILVVITYSRFLGAVGRGQMSIYLLYLQFVLMIGELLAGSAMANWLVKYKSGQILPWMALFSTSILVVSGVVLRFVIKLPTEILFPLLVQGLGLAWLNIQYNIYQSKGWIGRRNKLQMGLELCKLLTILGAVFFFPLNNLIFHGGKVQEMLVILASVTIMFLCLSVYKTLSVWKEAFAVQLPPKGIFFEGLWAQFGHVVLFFMNKFPLWLVAHFFGDSAAGVFANSLLIVDTIWIFSGSFGTVIHSRVIRHSNIHYHQRLIQRYCDFSLMGTIVLCIGVILVPNTIYVGIFGSNFEHLKSTTMWLIPGILFMGLASTLGNYMHAIHHFKRIFLNHLVSFLLMMGVFLLGYFQDLDQRIILLGMNFGYLMLLLLHLNSTKWVFKNDFNLKFNILLIRRLISIKLRVGR